MSDDVPEHYRPRLCHVVKWPEFQGYGFNLHAEKGKAGQFIGKVDDDSPAEAAGLKEGDRIVEVNGVNIGNENHQQVVARIKSGGEETRLLVVDTDSDNWFKEQKKVVRGDAPEIKFISAKREDPTESASNHEEEKQEEVQQSYSEPDSAPVPEPEIEPSIEPVIAAPNSNGNGIDEDHEQKPRLCHLKLWPHFQGYGFNLHAEKDKPGQYIGLVDENSPASTAGLRVNDRIVEVNGVNIEDEGHTEVIARIKAVPGETKLLVVDRDADSYYRGKGVTVSSSMPQTEYIATPDASDAPNQETAVEETPVEETPVVDEQVVEVESHMDALQVAEGVDLDDKKEEEEEVNNGDRGEWNINEEKEEVKVEEEEVKEESSHVNELEVVPPPPSPPPPAEEEKPEGAVNGLRTESHQAPAEPDYVVPKPQPVSTAPAPAPAPSNTGSDGLELNLSVAEMKERLKAKKKPDPRASKVSFEQKYKEFQRM